MDDVLVVGAGPAGLAIAASLCAAGLRVAGLTPADPGAPWLNTYGIWADELEPLGLAHMLGHRWSDCTTYAGGRELALGRDYGLIDNARLQAHLLTQCERGGVTWRRGAAARADHSATGSVVQTRDGAALAARLVVDASGHTPALVRRPASTHTAYQAAYGVVGTFSQPPVRPGQLVLMDYRADHLPPEERAAPPTFLYAMDLGGGRFFVEETSLAHVPGVGLGALERRLHRRLEAMGVRVHETEHVEHCLFPMNAPLPDLAQPVLGFGGAASMVHPASGYQVGAALRYAPQVAAAVAAALGSGAPPAKSARAGWRALWPSERVRRRNLYLFGLSSLLTCDEARLQAFFRTFFQLPRAQWSAYLSDRLSTPELAGVMLRLFASAPWDVRRMLAGGVGRDYGLLWRALRAAA
ncbi:MAG: hypothetical protein RLZZ387_2180 [Chloroflexota bacterium]|jgi:lycopene beta-cyclase